MEGNDRVFIDYLKNTLNKRLVERVSLMIDEPTIFEKWVEITIKHDNVWRRSQAMKQGLGRQFSNTCIVSFASSERRPRNYWRNKHASFAKNPDTSQKIAETDNDKGI
jgi:hypothetical protein